MQDTYEGFIIDVYSPYEKNDNDIIFTFKFHGLDMCIRKVTEFKWGKPVFHNKSIENSSDFIFYRIYDNVDEAYDYIEELRKLR